MKQTALFLTILWALAACGPRPGGNPPEAKPDWKPQFEELLPLLGHRNWIMVVDQAFPLQVSEGITALYTGEPLLPVLDYVMGQLGASGHATPVVYQDAELASLTPAMVPGVDAFRDSLSRSFGNFLPRPLLHDSVFTRIDAAGRLFRIVVLKTTATIPYSSVYLYLDCKYWSPEDEIELRMRMNS